VQSDEHLLTVLRYVERNPLRAKPVRRADQWRWGSYHVRRKAKHDLHPLISQGPIDLPADWSDWVHETQARGKKRRLATTFTATGHWATRTGR